MRQVRTFFSGARSVSNLEKRSPAISQLLEIWPKYNQSTGFHRLSSSLSPWHCHLSSWLEHLKTSPPPPLTHVHSTYSTACLFLLAAKPSGPRTVQVVLLVVWGGSSLMLTFGWVMSFLFPAYNFLWDGIRHSLTRFLFGVGSFISFSNHVFAAASRWTKSVLVQQTYGKVSNI